MPEPVPVETEQAVAEPEPAPAPEVVKLKSGDVETRFPDGRVETLRRRTRAVETRFPATDRAPERVVIRRPNGTVETRVPSIPTGSVVSTPYKPAGRGSFRLS